MPVTKQTPLTSPRGRVVTDLTQRHYDWEATVFDQAEYFVVSEMRMGVSREASGRDEFKSFPDALAFAKLHTRVCLYAVASCGRFVCLDKEVWDQWAIRWEQSQKEETKL